MKPGPRHTTSLSCRPQSLLLPGGPPQGRYASLTRSASGRPLTRPPARRNRQQSEQGEGPDKHRHHRDQTHRKPPDSTPCPGGLASGKANTCCDSRPPHTTPRTSRSAASWTSSAISSPGWPASLNGSAPPWTASTSAASPTAHSTTCRDRPNSEPSASVAST